MCWRGQEAQEAVEIERLKAALKNTRGVDGRWKANVDCGLI